MSIVEVVKAFVEVVGVLVSVIIFQVLCHFCFITVIIMILHQLFGGLPHKASRRVAYTLISRVLNKLKLVDILKVVKFVQNEICLCPLVFDTRL